MNRFHRWYCQSSRWKQVLENKILPWSLGGVDLGDEVLEVGPGPGLTTDWLRRQTKTITSIEVDSELADTLNRRLAGTNASVQCGDATAMPFGDRTFSGAVAFTMLHHVPSQELQDRVFAEVYRVLKPGHFRWNGQHVFFPDADISHPGHIGSRGSQDLAGPVGSSRVRGDQGRRGRWEIPVFRATPVPNISSDTIAGMAESAFTQGQTLAKVPIFSGLAENELSFLAQRALPRHYLAGEIIFGEGEPCSGLYVVESGHVRIFKSSASGREQVLSIDGPGSSMAELPVFDGGNYPASASAIDDANLLFVSKQDFQALCLAHPQVALKVLRVIGGRLRRLVGIIEELSFTTVRHRLASFLVRLAQKEGRRSAAGVVIALPVSNQELASQIGTVRELVSRNLSRLQAEGMITIDGREVVICNLKALEAETISVE